MADFISIDASELQDFGKQIGAAADLVREVSGRMVADIARDTVVFAQRQPAPPRGIKQPFKTDKQRRFFFSALRDGRITVPYQRTGNLYINWRYSLIPGSELFRAEIYNNVPYRKWVQGYEREQSKFHAPRWNSQEKIEQAAADAMPKRMAEAGTELERLFLARLGK